MTTVALTPTPRQLFLNPSNGAPAAGFLVFQFAAGTNTPQTTYKDSTGLVQNTNPIVLDSLGEADIWLDVTLAYKLVFSPPTDTNPPTNPIWTRDNINIYAGPVTFVANLPGFIGGLQLGAAGGVGTFNVAAGSASDSTGSFVMKLPSAFTKTTADWVVGSGNGGLDTGSIATSTWYHVYEIARLDTNVVDIIFSLNASAPALPANYTIYRRIGSMKTDGSSHWTQFYQVGNAFYWAVAVGDLSTNTLSTTPITTTLTVPTGIIVTAQLRGGASSATPGVFVLVNPLSETAAVPNAIIGNITYSTQVSNIGSFAPIAVVTNTSAQIRAVSTATSTSLVLATYGWIDLRGSE